MKRYLSSPVILVNRYIMVPWTKRRKLKIRFVFLKCKCQNYEKLQGTLIIHPCINKKNDSNLQVALSYGVRKKEIRKQWGNLVSKTLYIIIDSNVCLCQGAIRGQGSIVRGLRTITAQIRRSKNFPCASYRTGRVITEAGASRWGSYFTTIPFKSCQVEWPLFCQDCFHARNIIPLFFVKTREKGSKITILNFFSPRQFFFVSK